MNTVIDYYHQFVEYETNFDAQVMIDYTQEHVELPIFAITIYLFTIFWVPNVLPKAINLRRIFGYWNLLLSIFSIIGASRTVPILLTNLYQNGFVFTCCSDPKDWYLHGPSGLWTGIFVYSKIPELLDTFFLVFQKKKILFLHWFHHVTVLLYCWHAFHNRVGSGIWFIAMNYSVHSIMYMYYFLSVSGLVNFRKTKIVAPFITTVQILQMVTGIAVTITVALQYRAGGLEQCYTDPANYKLGLAMYLSYFILFCVLFYNNYVRGKKKKKARSADGSKTTMEMISEASEACDVGDAAGFFHGKNRQDSDATAVKGAAGSKKQQ